MLNLVDEMADITFSRSLSILMDALMASLQEILSFKFSPLHLITSCCNGKATQKQRSKINFVNLPTPGIFYPTGYSVSKTDRPETEHMS